MSLLLPLAAAVPLALYGDQPACSLGVMTFASCALSASVLHTSRSCSESLTFVLHSGVLPVTSR